MGLAILVHGVTSNWFDPLYKGKVKKKKIEFLYVYALKEPASIFALRFDTSSAILSYS
jgi:hypothetical protein